MKKYVAYLRVSTSKQDNGEQVQREALGKYNPEAWFVERVSGKGVEREQLLLALEYARENDCILLFYKVDRLARNASYALEIRNSGVELHCHTMPQMNLMVFGMMALMAQQEREDISSRTREALQLLKAKGVKLGCNAHKKPLPKEHYIRIQKLSQEKRRERAAKKLMAAKRIAKKYRSLGMTLTDIANELNQMGMKTSRGKDFHAVTVARLL